MVWPSLTWPVGLLDLVKVMEAGAQGVQVGQSK